MVLSAGKKSFPNENVFVENGNIVIGVGPNGKKYSSELSNIEIPFKSIDHLEYLIYNDISNCNFSTTYRYYTRFNNTKDISKNTDIKNELFKDNFQWSIQMNSNEDDIPYITKEILNMFELMEKSYINDTNELVQPKQVEELDETSLDKLTDLEFNKMFFKPNNNENSGPCSHLYTCYTRYKKKDVSPFVKMYSNKQEKYMKNDLLQYLMKENYHFNETITRNNIPVNSLFSLYCLYAVSHCKSFEDHQQLYSQFISIIKNIITTSKDISNIPLIPQCKYPYIMNLLCCLRFFLNVDHLKEKGLPEVGFIYSALPERVRNEYILYNDVSYFKTHNPQSGCDIFIEWYRQQIQQYNDTHPTPFYKRQECIHENLENLFEVKFKKGIEHQTYFLVIEKEIEDYTSLLENVSPSEYFLSIFYIIISIIPSLLTIQNDVFKPVNSMKIFEDKTNNYYERLKRCSFMKYIFKEEPQPKNCHSNSLYLRTSGIKKVYQMFKILEETLGKQFELRKRFDCIKNPWFIPRLLETKQHVIENTSYYLQLNQEQGCQLFREILNNNKNIVVEWVIQHKIHDKIEECRYLKVGQKRRISLIWYD
ncbi:Uncharacterized protein QTN25_008966 [Entamoeba marina]